MGERFLGGVEVYRSIEETSRSEWSQMAREAFSGAPIGAVMYESKRGLAIIGKDEEGMWRVEVENDSLPEMTTYFALDKKEAQALVAMLLG